MANKQSAAYEMITGAGVGLASTSFILGKSNFVDGGGTQATLELVNAVPAYAQRIGVLVETLESYASSGVANVTTIAVGITNTGNTWTSATTGTCTTIGYKVLFLYGATTVVTGLPTTAKESVFVTLTTTAAFSTLTTGKVKVTVIYLATQTL